VASGDPIFVHVSDAQGLVGPSRRLICSCSLSGLLGYLVLNIGLEIYKRATDWQNLSDGLFQIMSVRSAGFEIVDLSYIAPALQSVFNRYQPAS
jgi:hypothetical protein